MPAGRRPSSQEESRLPGGRAQAGEEAASRMASADRKQERTNTSMRRGRRIFPPIIPGPAGRSGGCWPSRSRTFNSGSGRRSLEDLAFEGQKSRGEASLERARPRNLHRELRLDPSRTRGQDHDPVGEIEGLLRVVRDEEHGLPPLLPEPGQRVLHPGARLGVEGAEGLVEQQDGRIGRQHARDLHHLRHARGQFLRIRFSNAESPISPSSSSLTARRAGGGSPLARRPNSMFSRTVIQGKMASSWRTYPFSDPGPSMGAPAHRTDPLVGRRKPAKMRSSVVFPHPTGPRTATNSPSPTSRLKPSRASVEVTPEYV